MRYECDVYATCVVPCYKIVFIFRNICMAMGIDVSIYAKTELLLSPLGVRIVALLGQGSDPGVPQLQFSQGARIVSRLQMEIITRRRYSPRKGREL